MSSIIFLYLKKNLCLHFSMVAESLICLALNVYFEARNQPLAGQVAVTQVVLNRVKSSDYPSTPCEVVYQAKTYASGFPVKYKCQFSWYCDGLADKPKDKKAFDEALRSVITVLNFPISDLTGGALFYHARTVYPKWASQKYRTVQIADHIFYR
tara:strand:+ start:10882 stop:11343 length:462 start_codon:yes stop_codon:yes gene_type:complete